VAPDPEDRYPSATGLTRALDEATLRAAGDDEARPYPGLAAFKRDDAAFFFGRELEVEALLAKLQPARLSAVVGASGAGKSSFLRAGLLPSLPESWSALVATPGNRPFVALARALAEVLPRDPVTVDSLLRFEEPAAALALISKWGELNDHCLLVLDQFEELFTQSPRQVQEAFADLLGRLPLEADVHVVLAMRDDFLLHCQAFRALKPIFSRLTPLGAPTGAALRRAIVEPARKCGYRFEDEALVEEMIAQVEGERGSLPMLAFAAARLWELRDREQGFLTREAYEHIGGVAGALAQHAEQTLARIGEEKIPIVRELFRNLVTAQGTRATRSRHQLLSVFDADSGDDRAGTGADPEEAEKVLDTLIDARLLTSYEVPGAETDRGHRTEIEIVHESLLESWPRLARWQAQEADSAQLRDQLRQAAQLWHDRDRSDDLLWSGSFYQEFQLWRERYPGGLTSEEEEFVAAMTAHAERRQRRRRTLTAAVITSLLLGLLVVGVLWRQASIARDRSQREALRAEANQLLALARLELEEDRTAALAYVTASLERVDAPSARRMALEILWSGPSALILDEAPVASLDFSPDGRWLAAGYPDGRLVFWSPEGERTALSRRTEGSFKHVRFSAGSDRLVTVSGRPDAVRVWSIPDLELVHAISSEDPLDARIAESAGRFLVFTKRADRVEVESWPLGGGVPEAFGDLPASLGDWSRWTLPWALQADDAVGRLAFVPLVTGERPQDGVQWNTVELWEARDRRFVSSGFTARHGAGVAGIAFSSDGGHLATGDIQGEVRVWSLDGPVRVPRRTFRQPAGIIRRLEFDRTSALLAAMTLSPGQTALWRMEGAPVTVPMILRRGSDNFTYDVAFDPGSSWLTTASEKGVMAYPIGRRHRQLLQDGDSQFEATSFLPDGSALASASTDGAVRLWPFSEAWSGSSDVLFDLGEARFSGIQAAPDSRSLLFSDVGGNVFWLPLDGGAPRLLFSGDRSGNPALALTTKTAAAAVWEHPEGASVFLWDLATRELRILVLGEQANPFDLAFGRDGSLLVADTRGIHLWDLEEETSRTISQRPGSFDLSADGRFLIAANQGDEGEAALYDLEEGSRKLLARHGPAYQVAIDRTGRLVATLGEELRVGSVEGEDPHYFVAPDLAPATERAALVGWERLEFSPDGRWIADCLGSNVVLWPVPDVTQQPLHTLPHQELVAKLRSLTNLRVVQDPESATGWTFAVDLFPGWETVPTW
jgi:WD40 repeat protein